MSGVLELDSCQLVEGGDPFRAAEDWRTRCEVMTGYRRLGLQAARLLLDTPLLRRRLHGFVNDAAGEIDFDGLLALIEGTESENLCRLARVAREMAWGARTDEPVHEWMLGLDDENSRRLVIAINVCWLYRPRALRVL